MIPIAGMYLLFFAAVGILLPFFSVYLSSKGFSSAQIGILLAIGPGVSTFAPYFWGHRADALGRFDVVLRWVCLGTLAGLSAIYLSHEFVALFLSLTFYALFSTSMTPLMDSITIEHVRQKGGEYSHLRLFGSLGFVFSSVAFGRFARPETSATIWVPAIFIVASMLWSFQLRAPVRSHREKISFAVGLTLLKRREIWLFLAITSMHWLASAPYHGLFGLHVQALQLPSMVLGISSGVAVVAEIGVLLLYPRFSTRFHARHLLFFTFAVTAFRWWGLSQTKDAPTLILLNLLHGISFGLFYVAAISYLTREVPPSLRAVGQSVFAATTFGVGGVLGFVTSGFGFGALGGSKLFLAAALVELIPCVAVWFLPQENSATPKEAFSHEV